MILFGWDWVGGHLFSFFSWQSHVLHDWGGQLFEDASNHIVERCLPSLIIYQRKVEISSFRILTRYKPMSIPSYTDKTVGIRELRIPWLDPEFPSSNESRVALYLFASPDPIMGLCYAPQACDLCALEIRLRVRPMESKMRTQGEWGGTERLVLFFCSLVFQRKRGRDGPVLGGLTYWWHNALMVQGSAISHSAFHTHTLLVSLRKTHNTLMKYTLS